MKKRILRIFIILFGTIAVLLIGLLFAFQVSPKPGAFLINRMFHKTENFTNSTKYDLAKKLVNLIENIEYQSNFKNNQLDIYYPKNSSGAVPILFWVHGGAYVGGDKSDITEFATYLCETINIAVVSINYQLAPSSGYPNHLHQLDEAYKYLDEKQDSYPMLNFKQIFFGGDSAGAQIAGQYVSIQTNSDYAYQMNMDAIINKDNLKGFISYCGLVDIEQMATTKTSSKVSDLFQKTVARSLIGTKEWKERKELKEASITNSVTSGFPPTFITDGNTNSFSKQGFALKEKLESLDVYVSPLFFEDSTEIIAHEYQFDYTTNKAEQCLNKTITFILEQLG